MCESVIYPRRKCLLVSSRSFCLKPNLSDPMAGNVCVYAVRGIGGLKNEAQRNVKPDLHVSVPDTELN